MILGLIAASMLACFSGDTRVYTGPPPRTTPLDSGLTGGPGRKLVPLPDSLTYGFAVPGQQPCSVRVEFYTVANNLVRVLLDSVYAPGQYNMKWAARDSTGQKLKERRYFYKYIICGKETTQRINYRRKFE